MKTPPSTRLSMTVYVSFNRERHMFNGWMGGGDDDEENDEDNNNNNDNVAYEICNIL